MLAGPRAGLLLSRRVALGIRCARPLSFPTRTDYTAQTRPEPIPSQRTLRSSVRHLTTSRPYSTNPKPSTKPEDVVATSPIPPQPTPNKRPRRRALYHSAIFLLLGISLGTLLRFALVPSPKPPPNTPADAHLTAQIREAGLALPLVQQLSSDPSWTSWDAYTNISPRAVTSRITSGPLSGSGGLPFQRIFHNAETGELVSVAYFGAATTGWPGVVHGGALATVLDETLGRCAILRFPARTGVTARLELTYRRPTVAARYYVVRARPAAVDGDGNAVDGDPAKSERKMWVDGTLETLDGKVCVRAKALFVVPKGVKLQPLVEGF